MRRKTVLAIAALPLLATLTAVTAPTASALPRLQGKSVEYNVLAAPGTSIETIEAAARAAGGKVVDRNAAVGLITVAAPEHGFTERVSKARGVTAAGKSRAVGQAPKTKSAPKPDVVEKEAAASASSLSPALQKAAEAKQNRANTQSRSAVQSVGMDPLDDKLWGLTSIRADLVRDHTIGDRRVKVGILDTGVDGKHPDIAPNFDRALSRNFAKDIPFDELGQVVDGPCEFRGCTDPSDWDDNGHGTHVAGTIAAAADGFGLSGVAPGVSIVNIRGAQDSGSFFLQPVVNAMTYAGDAGLDVVNMSFFVDPWLYNCDNNAADSPEQQAEQRTIKMAISRAMDYAYRKGVTQVVSLGNQHTDLGNPLPDASSPNYPANTTHPRTIDNATCLSLPIEGPHSIGVASYGPSGLKADYSNWGTEQISVSAPGGYARDYFGTPWFNTRENTILSTYPRNVALVNGHIDAAGNLTPAGVTAKIQRQVKPDGTLAFYQWLQGTSMASPHAAGVAALIVSKFGNYDARGGVLLNPDRVERVLQGTATKTPCPTPRTVDYLKEGRDASYTATCLGGLEFNGFHGTGQVDALQAVVSGADYL
ncbi:S8 family serine peptidase [Kibdelosporangium philippinense]|uniref:S8 family serine peptidase n=1 Tax=Kibdelosporangium philippinense TaxID=211113 RepID=A0ABS8ZLK3_9PSEU|nr:S8 family serine peptidase [Kibdelosporangium philippinense]MCE7008654.1 S8 family serine peptidase [Kibdelosporangium philippinense]